MKQQTFAVSNFEQYGKVTKKEAFLKKMNEVLPWDELESVMNHTIQKAMELDGSQLASFGC